MKRRSVKTLCSEILNAPAITLLDEFRIAIAAQTVVQDRFWDELTAPWWRDWKKRGVRKALVALHYGS